MNVRCRFESEILTPTFSRLPNLTVKVIGINAGEEIPLALIFIANGVSHDSLIESLENDETVTSVNQWTTSEKTVYRTIHPPDLPGVRVYNVGIDHDALFLDAENTGNEWEVQLSIPDREALAAFCDQSEEYDVDISVDSIRDRDAHMADKFGLTPSQREILILAWETGYFSIPRDVCLSDLADELNISQQAASERLRRGVWMLVSNTLCEGESSDGDQRR